MVVEKIWARIRNRNEILYRLEYLHVEFGQVLPKSKFHHVEVHPFISIEMFNSASTNASCVGQRWVPQANEGSMYATERVSFQEVLMPGVRQCLHRRSKVETAPTLLTQMQKMWSAVHEEGCRTYVIIEWYINMIFGLSYITHVPSEIGWYFALKPKWGGRGADLLMLLILLIFPVKQNGPKVA